MSCSRADYGRSAGYSVLEVLVAIGLLGAISALAVHGARGFGQQLEIGNSTALLTASLKEWRERSLRQSTSVVVSIDAHAGRLSSHGRVAELGPGLVLHRLDVPEAMSFLVFLPNGASSGARLAVSSPSWRFELHVDPFNGSVEVVR